MYNRMVTIEEISRKNTALPPSLTPAAADCGNLAGQLVNYSRVNLPEGGLSKVRSNSMVNSQPQTFDWTSSACFQEAVGGAGIFCN